MDQTNQFPPINTMPNSIPPMNGMPSSFPNAEKPKKFGPIIAILIVILVIVIVALYLLASSSSVRTFGGAQEDCVSGATDCIDFRQIIDNGGLEAGQPVPQQNVNVTGGVPNNGTVAPITNTADDVDSLQADLDASISGIDAQSI
jgi:hypothetical protein